MSEHKPARSGAVIRGSAGLAGIVTSVLGVAIANAESPAPTGRVADLLRVDCASVEDVVVMPPSTVSVEARVKQAQSAACKDDRRRELMAGTYKGGTLSVGYLVIGGGFAAQNVLANTTPEVRAKTVVVDVAMSGILAGSEDPGQGWDHIFTGHGPPAADVALTARWSVPNSFKPASGAKANASRLSLAYSLAMNEFALGVPVVPCTVKSIKKHGENGVEASCELVGSFVPASGSKIVTIRAERGAIDAGGLGLPKGLTACAAMTDSPRCQILKSDEEALSTNKPARSPLPFMFNEWNLFSNLRGEGGAPKINFAGKTLLVAGSSAAAASAITDILNPDYLPVENRPAKIVLIGDHDRLTKPDGFAPPVYTRGRLAGLCGLQTPVASDRAAACKDAADAAEKKWTENGYTLDYFAMDVPKIRGSQIATASAVTAMTLVSGVKMTFHRPDLKTPASPTNKAPPDILGDYLLTAISTDSPLTGLFDASLAGLKFEPLRCGSPAAPCGLTEVKSFKSVKDGAPAAYTFHADGAPIGIGAVASAALNFRVAGAAASNTPLDLLSADKFPTAEAALTAGAAWKAMVETYAKALMDDYEAAGIPGGKNNVNTGALLHNGWLTREFGKNLLAWYGASATATTNPYYAPTQTGGRVTVGLSSVNLPARLVDAAPEEVERYIQNLVDAAATHRAIEIAAQPD